MDDNEGNSYDPGSLHRYLYAGGNPVGRIDPTGHDYISTIGAVAVQGLLVGLSIGALLGGVTGGILGGWKGALVGLIGGAATGALFGAIGGGLAGVAIVTGTLWPLITYGTLMTGWGVYNGIRDLANPDPRHKIVGAITLVVTIVAAVFGARAINYLQNGKPFLPQYQRFSGNYEAAPDVPTVGAGMPDGKYIYAVRMDRSIAYYSRGAGRFPHPNLSKGENVLTAGEIEISGGKVTSINNSSGHFQPSDVSVYIAKWILMSKGMWGSDSAITPRP